MAPTDILGNKVIVPKYTISKKGKTEESKCSGTWCHACTNYGCCKEQKVWDRILGLDRKKEINIIYELVEWPLKERQKLVESHRYICVRVF